MGEGYGLKTVPLKGVFSASPYQNNENGSPKYSPMRFNASKKPLVVKANMESIPQDKTEQQNDMVLTRPLNRIGRAAIGWVNHRA